MWTKTFALAVLERALKTFAQSAAALLVAAGTGLLDADWVQIASVSGMAAVVSVLTSVGTGAVTDGSPSVRQRRDGRGVAAVRARACRLRRVGRRRPG